MRNNCPKKILQLSSSYGFFGAENVIAELSRELVSSDFTPIIGVFNNTKNPHLELIEFAKNNNISCHLFHCNGQFDFTTIISIRKFIKKNKIDLIHTHGYKSNFYAVLATLFYKTSRIVTCHPWIKTSFKMKFYSFIDKFLLNRFDKIITVSEALKSEIAEAGVALEKISIIPNGINITRFTQRYDVDEVRMQLGVPAHYKVIGTVGRLSVEKGHIILIEAARKILKKFPSTFFLIVGDGLLREELHQKTVNLAIGDHFLFTGLIDDVPKILSIIDLFVLPSLTEGLPMALLEAMAAKKPVIASAVGSIPQLIIHNKTGLLTQPADTEGLANSICELLQNQQKADQLAEAGYQTIVDNYTSKIMARRYMDVYHRLLNSV